MALVDFHGKEKLSAKKPAGFTSPFLHCIRSRGEFTPFSCWFGKCRQIKRGSRDCYLLVITSSEAQFTPLSFS